MILKEIHTRDPRHDDPSWKGYRIMWESENDVWLLGIKEVMFGHRVIAFREGSCGPTVDYCAADQPVFLVQLLAVIKKIFEGVPEEITERDLAVLLPGWQVRPINRDPHCWDRLQALARSLAAAPPARSRPLINNSEQLP